MSDSWDFTGIDKVLILGSGFSIEEFHDYPYRNKGWFVVTANNAYRWNLDIWDLAIMTYDCRNKSRITEVAHKFRPDQAIVLDYDTDEVNALYGDPRQRGLTIVIATSYYVLGTIKPKYIGYLGCDMNYRLGPDGKPTGNTAWHGVGSDFKERHISDPDLFIKHWGWKNNMTIEDYYNKLKLQAWKTLECELWNFSTDPDTRLPFQQIHPSELEDNYDGQDGERDDGV